MKINNSRKLNKINKLTTEILVYDMNRVLRRLTLVRYEYDFYLQTFLKWIANLRLIDIIEEIDRPQWCQHRVVFKWGFWQTKLDIQTFRTFTKCVIS